MTQPGRHTNYTSIYYQNVRGLNSKISQFYASVCDTEFSVIGLVETWLSEDVGNSELFPDTYTVYRKDRNRLQTGRKTGGGALLAINNINIISEDIDLKKLHECVPEIDIVGSKCKFSLITVFIYVVYIPPSISIENFMIFLDLFGDILIQNENILILGDFNVPNYVLKTNKTKKSQLVEEFEMMLNLKQSNNVLNCNNKLLDLVLSNLNCDIEHDNCPLVVEDNYHPALMINCDIDLPQVNESNNVDFKRYNFRKANFPDLYNALAQTNWDFLNDIQDVDEMCNEFYKTLYKLFDMQGV